MPPLGQILLGVWPPLAVALPLLILGWWRAGKDGAWANPLALGGGLLAALVALEGWPRLPPVSGSHWLVVSVVVAALVGAVDGGMRAPNSVAHAAAALVISAAVLLMTQRLAADWSLGEHAAHWGIAIGGLLVLSAALGPTAEIGGPLTPLHLTIVTAGAAFVVTTGSALLGQITGGLAAVLGACTALSLLRPAFRIGRGAALVTSLGVGGMLLAAHWFADVPVLPLVCVATAAGAGWLNAALHGTHAITRWGAVLGGSGVLLVAAVALVGGPDALGY